MASTAKGALTPKQSRFVDEYLIDLNATKAAIRADYSEKTAQQMGAENLSKPVIIDEIERRQEMRSHRTGINSDYVLHRLVEVDQLDVIDILDDNGSILPVREWPREWRVSITGLDAQEMMAGDITTVIKKIKWPDKLKNLELLGKHIAIQAFREQSKSELTGEGGGPIKVQDMSKDDMEALAKEFR